MRYLVTGATGFIGGRLARQLRDAGHDVVALARDPAKATGLRALGVDVRAGDVTDRASLRAPMESVDGVFHLAAAYKLGRAHHAGMERANVDGTLNVLETMRDLGIRKGVYTSTLAVNSDTRGRIVDESYRFDGKHLSEYDRTKWIAHHEVALPLMRAGLPLVVVMPGVVYGPGDTSSLRASIVQYLRGKLPAVPKGTTYAWSHVDDVARAHALAMEKGRAGEAYIVGGEIATLERFFALAEEITGVKAPRLKAPPALLKAGAALAGLVETVAPLPETYSREGLRETAGTTYLGTNEKARRELGYAPRPLAEGLRETLAHERKLLA